MRLAYIRKGDRRAGTEPGQQQAERGGPGATTVPSCTRVVVTCSPALSAATRPIAGASAGRSARTRPRPRRRWAARRGRSTDRITAAASRCAGASRQQPPKPPTASRRLQSPRHTHGTLPQLPAPRVTASRATGEGAADRDHDQRHPRLRAHEAADKPARAAAARRHRGISRHQGRRRSTVRSRAARSWVSLTPTPVHPRPRDGLGARAVWFSRDRTGAVLDD